ncbi:serine-type endopeptidase [Aureococcus anophagefferens]|nr:serine-type endopeptidase [Aureococcus anophagefferens]
MVSLHAALVALALTTSADAARNRRLQDNLDVPKLYEDAEEGKLSSRVLFKIDEAHRGDAAAVADKVASILECDAAPARVFREGGKFEAAHKAAGLDLHYKVSCGKDADHTAASKETFAALMKFLDSDDHDGVALVEAEYDESLSWTPDDPSLGTQTHYDAIGMAAAWDMNIWRNEGEICGDGVDNDGNGYVDDCHGYNHADDTGTDLLGNHWHGSHCGGTIAADNNNGLGVAGVAGGDGSADSGAKLMISVGFGKTAVDGFAEALVYGADMGAQISSNSWG